MTNFDFVYRFLNWVSKRSFLGGHSSVGRARASHARGRGFESRCPLFKPQFDPDVSLFFMNSFSGPELFRSHAMTNTGNSKSENKINTTFNFSQKICILWNSDVAEATLKI